MSKDLKELNRMNRHFLAYVVLLFSSAAITALAIFTIIENPDDAKDVFNMILPVFASWVGTILAFYFGRESFESANQQVRELVEKLAPEERANAKVTSIMRPFRDTTTFQIYRDQSLQDIQISQLRQRFSSGCSRLPIIDFEQKPLYMIHESMLDHYIASGHNEDHTLEQFMAWQTQRGLAFGAEAGFVTVAENSTIAAAKRKMEEVPSCQDIFITPEGKPDERLTGWISNLRLAKFLVA